MRTRPIKRDARSISLLYRDRHAHSSPLCASYIPTRKGMEEEWGKANGSVNNYPSIVHARLINSPFLLCLNFTPLILAIANSRITRISPTILPTFPSDRDPRVISFNRAQRSKRRISRDYRYNWGMDWIRYHY